jgi:hypothetical protein
VTSVVQVCNMALLQMSNRVQINSLNDNTPAANAANLFYTPKTQALLRAAPWPFCRKQTVLTQYKAAIVDGTTSDDPPPQNWAYEYLRPADCLRARFLQPTLTTAQAGVPLTTSPNYTLPAPNVPTGVPFVDAMDVDTNGNPIPVILTNMQSAQLIYTADLSQYPDMWDPMFLNAETAMLASFFAQALTGDQALVGGQVSIAKMALDAARAVAASESISSVDHIPDWMQARMTSAGGYAPWAPNAAGGVVGAMWDSFGFPNGQFY